MSGFEYPWFLLGLAFLAVPVVLHLMNREIPRRLVFPSTRFLRRAQLPPEGRRRLRDLLLLLLRLAALAAAVLAFARPTLRRAAAPGRGAEAAGAVTVLLADLSASMGAKGAPERLTELARGELRKLAEGERVGLILSADRVLSSMPPGTRPADLLTALAAAAPRPVPGHHAAAIREAARLLAGPGPRRLLVLSDLQVADWQECREQLPSGTEVRLLNPADPGLANVGVIGALASPTSAGRCRVIVEVRNFAEVAQQRTLTVRAGPDRQSVPVSLPPLQVRRVAVALRHDGAVHGVAELTPDDYAADDALHFWAAAPPSVPVVAVVPVTDGGAAPDPQAFFLAKSLHDSAAAFQVQTVTAEAFFATDLSHVPLVFVLGAADRFDEAAFAQLKNFCTAGGTAVCTPGPFPGQMMHGLRASGLFDARLTEVVGQGRRRGESWSLGWVNPEGVLAEAFAEAERTDLFIFPIRQFLRLNLSGSQTVQLKTTDGDPVLAEQTVGRGRVLVFALPFDPQWSDLPLTASFLPMIQEIARTAVPAGYGITRVDCGQPIPEFRDLLGRVAASSGQAQSTAEPGVFALGDRPVEVNISRRESSSERLNPYDLIHRLVSEAPTTATGTAVPRAELPVRLPLWPVAALLAAGLFLLEVGLTLWTDHREIRGRLPTGR
jgi:hypothetical protein